MRTSVLRRMMLLAVVFSSVFLVQGALAKPPNILVIMGDDIGLWNISHINRGMMGYKTPNIDRLAKEGTMFTDYYAEQSCTAGRSAFITGQSTVRTGLTKVGLPGSDLGIRKEDPTLAELLKPMGYMTGQFGKNHFGDKDEFLPTNHGFDEFFGNLYHLNAEEEPEEPDYPKDPEFRKQFGPRGVIKSTADGKIEDTGPLTRKRMETCDEEFLAATVDFIQRSVKAGKPFFAWFNTSRMHFWTHVKDASMGKTDQGFYADAMVEHDGHVGQVLKLLDDLDIADNTVVIYTTDNGPHYNAWPDGAVSPFRGEKNTNWEGGYRVPAFVRWPGKIKSNHTANGMFAHLDWVPTLMAAAGEDDIKDKLLKGHRAGDMKYKVHLDGYNQLPYLMGKEDESRRNLFFYFNDDGQLVNVRWNDWKLVFAEQRAHGFAVWSDPFVWLRLPKIFNLRRDPFERADLDSMVYEKWWVNHAFLIMPMAAQVQQFVMTFKNYPPRQKPAKFNVDAIMEMLYSFMPAKS